MKILVLHNSESLLNARRSILDYIFCFERYAPEHQYVYHRIMLPPTATLMSTAWDAVIFDSTALGIVSIRPREKFHRIRERWAFLCRSRAVKLAFPQDDASHSAILDLWFTWMNVDAVFSVRPELKNKLYPLTSSRAEFLSTVSGFVDDATLAELAKFSKSFEARQYTFGQRATMYPAWGGRFAQRKGVAAARLAQECQNRGIPANISTDPKDVFLGDDWYQFLGDCKFVVGAEGGHGIWDPYGAIQDSVNDYAARYPEATFAEIESFCFPGLDGRDVFPGFAPRVLEAAMLGCGQVLVEGHYRGFIKPGEHYIPLKEDYSNLDEVFAAISDVDRVRCMIEATDRDLVKSPRFRFSTLVREVIDFIKMTRSGAREGSDALTPGDLKRHFEELEIALYGIGIVTERLYEPFLTTWVRRELGGQVTDPTLRTRMGLDEGEKSIRSSPASPPCKTRADKLAEVLGAMGYKIDNFEELAVALSTQQPGDTDKLLSKVIGLIRDGHRDVLDDLVFCVREGYADVLHSLLGLIRHDQSDAVRDIIRLLDDGHADALRVLSQVPRENRSGVLRDTIETLQDSGKVLQDVVLLVRSGHGRALREFVSFLRDDAERDDSSERRAVLASQLLPVIQHSTFRVVLLRLLVKLHL